MFSKTFITKAILTAGAAAAFAGAVLPGTAQASEVVVRINLPQPHVDHYVRYGSPAFGAYRFHERRVAFIRAPRRFRFRYIGGYVPRREHARFTRFNGRLNLHVHRISFEHNTWRR